MQSTSLSLRLALFLICSGLPLASVYAQGPAKVEPTPATSPDQFTFTLNSQQDVALKHIVETLEERDLIRHARELEEANASIFSKTLDLLRYVPIRVSGSDDQDDDFFTPNYLRSDYGQVSTRALLFEPR